MREQATTRDIESLLNRIRGNPTERGEVDQASKDIDTLLEVADAAVAALNVRYRHYGPSGELRVEPDEWVKAEDVLSAMCAALQVGLVRGIFEKGNSKEEGS